MDKLVKSSPFHGGDSEFEPQWEYTMKTNVTFFKQDGKWYADIPEHTLEENEMVMGSDQLLDMLSGGDFDILTLSLQDEETDSCLLGFKMTDHDDDGAYYTLNGSLYNFYLDTIQSENDILTTIWICNVTHDVFGEHPKEIYLTNISQHKSTVSEEDVNKTYDKKQCVYGEDSTMPCMFCSAMCKERYEDFTKKGVKIAFI